MNTAIVILTKGSVGGAEKRFINLFQEYHKNYGSRLYLITSSFLYEYIEANYKEFPLDYLFCVRESRLFLRKIRKECDNQTAVSSPTAASKEISQIRKIIRFSRSYLTQKYFYYQIDSLKKKLSITTFLGVYSGILPFYFYFGKSIKRKPHIIFSHMDSWFWDTYNKSSMPWYRKYTTFNCAIEYADHLDLLSPFILEGLVSRGFRVTEHSYSIAPSSFTDYSKCYDKTSEQIVIAFVGRLEPDKNPLLFLELAEVFKSEFPSIQFIIMGAGSLGESVQRAIVKNKLHNVEYSGFVVDAAAYLAQSSIFISLQTYTNYPSQSVLEAMACGNAIVASNVGDTHLFINENTGVLCDLKIESLVSSTKLLVNDSLKLNAIRKYNMRYVREVHTVSKMLEYYNHLFTSKRLVN